MMAGLIMELVPWPLNLSRKFEIHAIACGLGIVRFLVCYKLVFRLLERN